ncbi:MAG TPA: hypothetical protein VFE05_19600 [Longimicrobiaceae bacterium]|nr:hypothetical protein [Longimicrobiaceae bacterium]
MRPAPPTRTLFRFTAVQRRSVTSLFSNLVTRPTGRAIRTGVESQIAEMECGDREVCLSVLDFTQVRVLDYSCADEIVAKLLLRYQGDERPAEAYFVVRGLQEHHVEAVEAVLERHGLLLVSENEEGGGFQLLGLTDPLQRAVWDALIAAGRVSTADVAGTTGIAEDAVAAALDTLCVRRVAALHSDGTVSPLPFLLPPA